MDVPAPASDHPERRDVLEDTAAVLAEPAPEEVVVVGGATADERAAARTAATAGAITPARVELAALAGPGPDPVLLLVLGFAPDDDLGRFGSRLADPGQAGMLDPDADPTFRTAWRSILTDGGELDALLLVLAWDGDPAPEAVIRCPVDDPATRALVREVAAAGGVVCCLLRPAMDEVLATREGAVLGLVTRSVAFPVNAAPTLATRLAPR